LHTHARIESHVLRWLSAAALLAGLTLSAPAPALAAGSTFTVTKTADTNDGDCSLADCSLREAIGAANAASDADTIVLPAGGYALTQGQLIISNPLVLDGALSSTTIVTASSFASIFRINAAISTTLSGLSLEGGDNIAGGAINNYGSLWLLDSTVSQNFGVLAGGVYNNGALTIQRSALVHNSMGLAGDGGGLYNGGSVTITASLIAHNSAGQGAGLYNAGTLSLTASTVSDNRSYYIYGGAGIYNSGTLTVTGSTLSGNAGLDFGSGVLNRGTGKVWLDGTVVEYNQGAVGSGLWNNDTGQLTLSNSAVINNAGGGIENGGALTVTNSTISDNFLPPGPNGPLPFEYASGIHGAGTMDLNNVTLYGGVSYGLDNTGGTVNARNTVFAGIVPGFGCFGTVNSQGYNLTEPGACTLTGDTTTVVTTSTPALGLLQENGGGTFTQPLLAGSPALEAGDPDSPGSGGLACEAVDQRGVTRPQGALCDLGASEGSDTALSDLAISERSSLDSDYAGSATTYGLGFLDTSVPVGVGSALTYTVLVTNVTGALASGVRLTETLPASAALGAAAASQGSCAASGSQLLCGPLSLASGARLTVTLVVTPVERGLLLNKIQATSDATPLGAVNATLVDAAQASVFTPQASAALPAITEGALAWGDYDHDGRLDVLVSGSISSTARLARMYHNNGDGTFTDASAGLTAVSNSAAAWGDYNNDGWLDLALAGYDGANPVTRLYRNNGNCTFTDIGAGLAGVQNGALAWGDYNGDGRADLLVTGQGATGRLSTLYRNDGNGVFTDSGVSFPALSYSDAAWGDYNNDGRPDLALIGDDGANSVSVVYRNDGGGVFTALGLPFTFYGVSHGSAVWADLDNDGRLDLVLGGFDGSSYNNGGGLYFWRNTGADAFALSNFYGLGNPAHVAVGDYDNDGRADVFAGTANGAELLLHNEGNSIYTDALAGLFSAASGAWGDADGNGKLDLLLVDYTAYNQTGTQLWHNDLAAANAAPGAPGGLTATLSGTTALLGWDAASDDHTPAAGLSYNLRVGTTPGGSDVLSPLAAADGTRRLPALGNAGESLTATLQSLLPATTYYWSVQAIDGAYLGSVFAAEGSFTTGPLVQWSSAAYSAPESAGGLVLTATLDATSAQTVTVAYATHNGSALAGSDYLAVNGILTFTPGLSALTVTVPLVDNALDQPDRSLSVTLSSPAGAVLGTPVTATVTILDDDPPPAASFTTAAQTVSETAGRVTATVTLDAASALTVTVPYTVSGTATGGGVDYTLPNGSFIIAPASLTATLALSLTNDLLVEPDETVVLSLTAPSNATLGAQAVMTITLQSDDTQPPAVASFVTTTQTVSESAGLVTATIALDTPSALTITVPYTANGTATGGGVDYALSSGSFIIPAGSLTATVAITITNDTLFEPDETVVLTLGAPDNAILGADTVLTLTIQNDDPPPTVAFIMPAQAVSEAVGLVTATVSLNTASALTVSVPYTVSGTATGGVDYTLPDGNFIIPAGALTATVAFSLTNDLLVEPDETIRLALGMPVNATLGANQVQTVTIRDDDTAPVFRIYLPHVRR
jgi:CSLREA domain-containing protein/uncharacterized repeat protein (TIGR01451 family)